VGLNQMTQTEIFEFNLRVGKVLEAERTRAGVSREDLAEIFSLEPREVASWETGFASPRANLFYRIMVHLGPEAYEAATRLWMDIQIEQYHMRKETKCGLSEPFENKDTATAS
jgi:transcriptional regulator with XRE-family HTH domain